MEMLTVAMLVILVYLVYHLSTRNLSYFEKFGVPYFPGKPFIGSTFTLFTRKHFADILIEIYNAFPNAKYVGAFDLMQPIIIVRDLELIKSITIKNFDSFPDHKISVDRDLDPLFGRNLFKTKGEQWRENRNLISPTFTLSKMKAMSELIFESAKNFVTSLSALPDDVRKMVDTKDLFLKFTTDTIASCAFGYSIDSVKDPNNEFFVRSKNATNFGSGKMTAKLMLSKISPWLMKLLKIKFVDDESTKFFIDIVKTSVQQRKERGINRPDLIQLLMNAKDKDDKHSEFDYLDMTAQSMIFIFGGLGTTASQMSVIAQEIVLNNDIQKRLQAEIDDVMRISDGKPSYEMINKMPYLDAIFNESMRRHSQFHLLDRVCVKPFELSPSLPGGKPFTMQPGMGVWIPTAAIHRDPQYYENPDKFDPDRYYRKKVTINDTENLSFGIGPRACVGNRFGIMETKIFFCYLLHQFELVPNAKTRSLEKYDITKTIEVRPEGGFWMSIEKRNRTC